MEYFGNNSYGNGAQSSDGNTVWNDNVNIVYTCPGTGAKRVDELGAAMSANSACNIRCAIYDTSGNLLMEGSAVIAVSGAVMQWWSHTSFIDKNGNPLSSPQLTGGTSYILVVTCGTGDAFLRVTTVTSGYAKVNISDNTAGFPDTLPSPSDYAYQASVRCGVSDAPPADPIASNLIL